MGSDGHICVWPHRFTFCCTNVKCMQGLWRLVVSVHLLVPWGPWIMVTPGIAVLLSTGFCFCVLVSLFLCEDSGRPQVRLPLMRSSQNQVEVLFFTYILKVK